MARGAPCAARIPYRVLKAQHGQLRSSRHERLKVSGNPSQYDDLSVFVREQEFMEELVSGSRLPYYVLDVSDNNIHGAVERTADWLERRGGIYQS